MLLLKHLPGWTGDDPGLELALFLSLGVVRNVTKLHCDLLVSLQEQGDGDGQQEIVKREDEDEGPGVVEALVDGVVLRGVSDTKGEANDREDGAHQGTSLLYICACHEV